MLLLEPRECVSLEHTYPYRDSSGQKLVEIITPKILNIEYLFQGVESQGLGLFCFVVIYKI